MKKVIFAAILAAGISTICLPSNSQAASAWASAKLDLVSIYNATVYIRFDSNKYLIYTGTGATDSTTINRIYATCLAAISNDQYVQVYTDLAVETSPGSSTYAFTGIRLRDQGFTP